LFVDHDHATGALRGILCNLCNSGIGALGDSVEGLREALRYLENALQNTAGLVVPKKKRLLRINLLNHKGVT
jgi:hypothetical protein